MNVVANANGNHIVLKGAPEACEHARRVLEALYGRVSARRADRARRRRRRDRGGRVAGFVVPEGGRERAPRLRRDPHAQARRRQGPHRHAQDLYLRALKKYELVFAEGPAGTGKTWLAVGHAVSLLERGAVDRLILSRPAVEAGERLGFLPGDMREKIDPYLRPIYDALNEFMDARTVERSMQTGIIEVAPLAFMRGRTLSNACILLDEAQNTTSMQMKMMLTRLGEGSRMIINGDPSQTDLPSGQKSGLTEAVGLLSNVEGIGHVRFRESDVVRHDLVRRIVSAYDRASRVAHEARIAQDARGAQDARDARDSMSQEAAKPTR